MLDVPIELENDIVPNDPHSVSIPPAAVQQPMYALMHMDQAMSMPDPLQPSEAAEESIDRPVLPGPSLTHATISANGAKKTFYEAISTLLKNKLLPQQHSSILRSPQHSIAECNIRPHIAAFSESLIHQLESMWPPSFKSSHVWGPYVSSFQRFTTEQELAIGGRQP